MRILASSTAVITALALAWAPRAHADAFGADLAFLSALVAKAVEAATTANKVLNTAQDSYSELRRVAGLAQGAADAVHQFSEMNPELWGQEFGAAFEQAFPSLGEIRRESHRLSAGGRWADDHGEFGRLMRVCLSSGDCSQMQEAVSLSDTRAALEGVFGKPTNAAGAAAQSEAAIAIAGGSASDGQAALRRIRAKALEEQCRFLMAMQHPGAGAACAAAADAAALDQAETDSSLLEAAAQANRLAAQQLLLEEQRRKQEHLDAFERREQLRLGAEELGRPLPAIETDGFNLVQELAQ